MKEILVATKNNGKLMEIREILGDEDISFKTLSDYPDIDIIESGETFFENALIKAKAAASAFGVVALGDDSGLVVDALGGRPGVHSRWFAGECATDEANNILLLEMIKEIPFEKRTAHFISVIVIAMPDGSYISAEGRIDGYIAFKPKGEGGFGYDPLFYVPAMNKTFAELSSEEKNSMSHRKNALEKIKKQM